MSDNKRIAKNTMFLYFRMLLSMVVSLYTARVVLNALGASDYGLYNVVGGVITILSVLTVLVSSGTQRFLNYEMGQNAPVSRLKEIFTASLTIYFIIYAIIFVIAETIGLWFVNTKLVIPTDRLFASNVIYQLTIVQMLLSFIQSTYTSAILAHERMDIYGYVGIGEPVLRLILISLLPLCAFDKLIAYGFIVFFMGGSVTLFYIYFCSKNFKECCFQISKNVKQIRSMLNFTVWNLLEALSNVLRDQGHNIILNLFFGPLVNAARAVAVQVNNAVRGFASNFLIAAYPQITKKYSEGNTSEFFNLMIRSGKFSFLILSVIMIPIMINSDYILSIWLKNPPENADKYVVLVMAAVLVSMPSEPLYTGIQASGNIKQYQLTTNTITLLNLPICYFALKVWEIPDLVFYINILTAIFFVIARLVYIKKLTCFPSGTYVKVLILRCVLPFIICILPFLLINSKIKLSLAAFLLVSVASVIWSCLVYFILSLTRNERMFIKRFLIRK